MPHATMNMAQLSRYLHIPENQVRKLVDRGTIPSRRVNGEYIFSREEVHRWLEQRIGDSDDAELVQVEKALDRTRPPDSIEHTITVTGSIPDGAICVPLRASTRDSTIRSMAKLATQTGLLWDESAMIQALKQREELHSTALDNGVALLHPRRPMPNILGDTFITLGITASGIPFGGGNSGLTSIFFLLCSMDDRIHLRLLARLSRMLTQPGFVEQLRILENESEIRAFLEEAESSVSD